jgi:hypothetical protein
MLSAFGFGSEDWLGLGAEARILWEPFRGAEAPRSPTHRSTLLSKRIAQDFFDPRGRTVLRTCNVEPANTTSGGIAF